LTGIVNWDSIANKLKEVKVPTKKRDKKEVELSEKETKQIKTVNNLV
jgi:hypothetical protein